MGVMKESNLYIDDITKERLTKIAKKNGRTLVAQVRYWVNLK